MVTLTHDSRDTKWAGTVQFEKFELKKKAGDRFCVFERTKEESNWQLNPKKKFKRCHFLACTHWRQIEQVNNDNSTNNTLGVTTDWHDDWQDKPFSGCDTFFQIFVFISFFVKTKCLHVLAISEWNCSKLVFFLKNAFSFKK